MSVGPRFDIVWDEHGCHLDYHFCREWTMDVHGNEIGCYGTNPDHGYTFDEAKVEVAEYLERKAKEWRNATLKDWEEFKLG